MRPGELCRLLIEEVDLDDGWIFIRNKAELGWRIKTGRERKIPLVPELVPCCVA
jgi:integrase